MTSPIATRVTQYAVAVPSMSPRMDGTVSWVHVSPIFIDRASAESALAQFPSTRADRVVVYRYGSGEWKEVPKHKRSNGK